MSVELSSHYRSRQPSVIREAQIIFSRRKDKDLIKVVNMAIGNIHLPMHPVLQKRMKELGDTRFSDGVVKYTPSEGTKDAKGAFLNIISSDGSDISDLNCIVTDGGSQAMELMMLGVCGPSAKKPLVLLDPAYTNYLEFGKRLSIPIISLDRTMRDDGTFEDMDFDSLELLIKKNNPAGLLVIPFDNPTGQFLSQEQLIKIAKLCVHHGLWLISDEAYRPLFYGDGNSSSVWKITEDMVSGIKGIRISIESASKVWNACGLRIGSLVTDNHDFHTKSVSEYTANLCANALGQEIFGGLAYESHENLNKWFDLQKKYYKKTMNLLRTNFLKEIPGLIVTKPEAAIYFIIDFRNICDSSFDAVSFIHYCASEGKVDIEGDLFTLLLAPMGGFYKNKKSGKTQLRVAIVETEDLMNKAPKVLSQLYSSYLNL